MRRVPKIGVRVRHNLDESPSGVFLSTNPGHADFVKSIMSMRTEKIMRQPKIGVRVTHHRDGGYTLSENPEHKQFIQAMDIMRGKTSDILHNNQS